MQRANHLGTPWTKVCGLCVHTAECSAEHNCLSIVKQCLSRVSSTDIPARYGIYNLFPSTTSQSLADESSGRGWEELNFPGLGSKARREQREDVKVCLCSTGHHRIENNYFFSFHPQYIWCFFSHERMINPTQLSSQITGTGRFFFSPLQLTTLCQFAKTKLNMWALPNHLSSVLTFYLNHLHTCRILKETFTWSSITINILKLHMQKDQCELLSLIIDITSLTEYNDCITNFKLSHHVS